MKPPAHLAQHLARQWQRADWRERHLLNARDGDAWPLRLPIGIPGAARFRDDGAALRAHLQQWRTIAEHGPGAVEWEQRSYRAGSAPVAVPTHWVLQRPADCMAAIARHGGSEGVQAAASHQALAAVLAQVDPCFHRLLLRRLALWRCTPADEVATAARIAMALAPGCADGKPLRALAVAGNDSKFFERNASLVTALLDERFDGEASRQGLTTFLGACGEDDHWLLVAPLAPGLLPFARQRVAASELLTTPLPAPHILLVENERCLHQLPRPLPRTIAVLGSGLDLNWLAAPWLRSRNVAYWGDLDTWGLRMLATARGHLPGLHALLMDRVTFDAHQNRAVVEPVHADALPAGLLPEEAALDQHLRGLERGRVEQEFLPIDVVRQAVRRWLGEPP
ncbi:MAG: DUF2220 family protein [Acidovorax sp.]|uniref:Wadjet anti-phage system protein JetD domain-containing protein n=1 Tax=Acidovorax sp. TaxID=1872122 RepID=UPI0039E5B1D5